MIWASSEVCADDPVVGANTYAFWAVQQYSTGNPRAAIGLIEAALAHALGSALPA